MGVDFLRSKAKSFVKAFDRGRAEIVRKNLFTMAPDGVMPTFVAQTRPECALKVGDPVLMRVDGDRMLIMVDLVEYGRAVRPPQVVMETVAMGGGYARGHVAACYPTQHAFEVAVDL